MTDSNSNSFASLLDKARLGDEKALGDLLQNHRDYLLKIANQELDADLKPKVGSSDVVQESLLTAHQKFIQFVGHSQPELLAWLRQILLNDVHHARRSYKGTKKRQLDRERSLQFKSSLDLGLADENNTPATNALVTEKLAQLESAIAEMQEDYQQVLRLHSFEQQSFEEVGEAMGRSADASRKLWTRAVMKLQEILAKK